MACNPDLDWKAENKAEPVLIFLRQHVPPFFPETGWTDPPKCMPEILHADVNGTPFSVVDSYRLFYTTYKVKVCVTRLRWEPHVEQPDFFPYWQNYVATQRPDILAEMLRDI
jgi:hypothetical protein